MQRWGLSDRAEFVRFSPFIDDAIYEGGKEK